MCVWHPTQLKLHYSVVQLLLTNTHNVQETGELLL